MKPSHVSQALTRIAAALDSSNQPSRTLVARDLRRILAAVEGSKIYRIITDEPQGICVGFIPSPQALQQIGAETDEWDLVEDDGSDGTPYLTGDGNGVAILNMEINDPNVPEGYSPLGMDMGVWRSEADMLEALAPGPSPEFYVIRISKDAWVIRPFDENVSSTLEPGPDGVVEGADDLNGILQAIKGHNISLMMDSGGDNVEWMQGDAVSPDMLNGMEIHS